MLLCGKSTGRLLLNPFDLRQDRVQRESSIGTRHIKEIHTYRIYYYMLFRASCSSCWSEFASRRKVTHHVSRSQYALTERLNSFTERKLSVR